MARDKLDLVDKAAVFIFGMAAGLGVAGLIVILLSILGGWVI